MNIVQKLYYQVLRTRDLYRFSLIKKDMSSIPVLSYLDMHNFKTGGAVKLHTLNLKYPQSRSSFNILYLVSSMLPSNTLELIEICKLKKIKIVWNQNGVGFPAWNDNYHELNSFFKKCMESSDYVIYQSKFCKRSSDLFIGKINKPYSIIYNPVELKMFSNKTRTNTSVELRLLVMGSHHHKERVDIPQAALMHLQAKGLRVMLNVGGNLKWDGADKIRGENINYIGEYSRNKAASIYQASDILLHISDKDACPTVPIEAMACGLPVVGLESGGMPEIVTKKAGVLIKVDQDYNKMHFPSSAEVADAVLKIYKNLYSYSKHARKHSKKFSSYKWLKKHEEIFVKLLK